MAPDPIDRPVIRLAVGVLLGLPLSVVAVFAVPHGLILGYAGLLEGEVLNLLAGISTILGLLAILAAWYRLIVPRSEMSQPKVRAVRAGLFCGVLCSVGLALWAASASWFLMAAALLLLAATGAMFIRHTPIHNAA